MIYQSWSSFKSAMLSLLYIKPTYLLKIISITDTYKTEQFKLQNQNLGYFFSGFILLKT